ncbi:uncharacterized protein LOC114916131 [Cajanus cajan]|uniref:uncharacterized protein LOC114916131 n=1 Tax=Cajanus cajan TaxID=3821 RepID=UPI0010FAF1C2|nr:uncharacterized protein LOC114916131 [Cajanus cajan]
MAGLKNKERGLEQLMGKSKWRELKAKSNIEELEVPEPGEEVAPLETRRKRKRGPDEVREASNLPVLEEVTSKITDPPGTIDLTVSPRAESPSSEPVVEAIPLRHATLTSALVEVSEGGPSSPAIPTAAPPISTSANPGASSA